MSPQILITLRNMTHTEVLWYSVLQVHTENDVLEADLVVSTINAKSLSSILTGVPSVTDILSSLPAVHVATVCLEYPISPKDIPQVRPNVGLYLYHKMIGYDRLHVP